MVRKNKKKQRKIKGPIIRDSKTGAYAHQCFCGIRLSSNVITCGSGDCTNLASQFGTVSNWLSQASFISIDINFVHEFAEKKVAQHLQKVFGATQKIIAYETGLAISTVNNTLIRLEKYGIVWRDEFHDSHGNVVAKPQGKKSILWRIY